MIQLAKTFWSNASKQIHQYLHLMTYHMDIDKIAKNKKRDTFYFYTQVISLTTEALLQRKIFFSLKYSKNLLLSIKMRYYA